MFIQKYMCGVILIMLYVLLSPFAFAAASEDMSIPIVSYIRTWPIGSEPADMDLGKRWTADDIQGNLLTTLNIAFGLLDGNKIYIQDLADRAAETDHSITILAFEELFTEIARAKERHPHLKANLSVGGWGADGFSDMALTAENRASFIADATEWIQKHNLDGIDIDWEYPVGPPWGGLPIVTRPEDAQTYIVLLQEMRLAMDTLSAKLNRPLTLTVAVPASPWFIEAIDVMAVQEEVDYLKLMSYDYYGAWSGTTGHAANLYNNPTDPEWGGWSTDQAVTAFLNAGIRPEKLLMGVPFYARAWRGVPSNNNGLFQPYEADTFPDGLSYVDIQSKILTDPGYTRYWDDVAKAPFLYNGDIFITYEDAESLAHKVAYIREKGLGGIMIWEYGHDLQAELLQALNKAIKGE